MYHSITFGQKNTWDDWYLIPSSRPVFNPPQLKTVYVTVPGSNTVIDLSEALTGYPSYEYREGSLEFIVDNGHKEWYEIYSDVMNYLHGKRMKAVLEDDPFYYYEGRFSVNSWKSDEHNSKITIDYYVNPYKFDITSSSGKWLWDSFSFETGIIREYFNLAVNSSNPVTLMIEGSNMRVIPTIKAIIDPGHSITINYNGVTRTLSNGDNKFADLVVFRDPVTLKFNGMGVVSVDYRGGSL